MKPVWLIVLSIALSLFVAGPVRDVLATEAGLHLPYGLVLAVICAVLLPLAWRDRWPNISLAALPIWRLHFSRSAFMMQVGFGPLNRLSWPDLTGFSLKGTSRPGLWYMRITCTQSPVSSLPPATDWLVHCDEKAAAGIRAYVDACRIGRKSDLPHLDPVIGATSATMEYLVAPGQGPEVDELRLVQCPDCGYDFAGLPTGHRCCPECGFTCETDSLIVLYGSNALRPSQFPLWRVGIAFVGSAMLDGLLSSIVKRHGGSPLAGNSLCIALMMTYMISWLNRRRARQAPEQRLPFYGVGHSWPGQLRLSPVGYGLRTGYGLCRMQTWSSIMYLDITLLKGSTYRARISDWSRPEASAYIGAQIDFDSTPQTVRMILDRVQRWRAHHSGSVGKGSRQVEVVQ
jgi:hypothetical protein